MKTQIYSVAEHNFSLTMESSNPLWNTLHAFDPFMVDEAESDLIFQLQVVPEVNQESVQLVIEAEPNREDGMVSIEVNKSSEGYLLQLTQPMSDVVNATLHIPTSNATTSEVSLQGALDMQLQALNNAMILNYLVAGAKRNTILLHSSVVMLEGKSYLFLGKSGTGKSTHSRMWLQAFPTSELLNDDHPIVRITDSGEIIAYGSPWSGKCPCYKNISAPLGGIIRIEQSPTNEAIVLRPSAAYASIMTSSSGLQWIPEVAELKIETLSQIVAKIPSLRMRCLPNTDAAIVCKAKLDSIHNEN